MAATDLLSERLLVFAPTGRDAQLLGRELGKLSTVEICLSPEQFLRELIRGVGVVIIAEEALTIALGESLVCGRAGQEAWSDVPFVVLAGTRSATSRGHDVRTERDLISKLEALGHVAILERPVGIRALVGVVRVALESRKRQYVMQVLHRNLEALNHGKDEFLAMLGHEMRNPLNAIHAALAILQTAPADDRRRAHLMELIERQTRSMTRMLDDILDVSRLSLGKLQLEGEDLDLRELVLRCVDMLQPSVARAQHTLTVDIAEGAFPVRGDPIRFDQVVTNVVGNAIKYTPPGGRIDVSVTRDDVDAVITVRDNGIGVAPEMLPKVFELFTQARNGAARAQGGLGVGLALTDTLVRMHGGRVQMTSEGLGQGSQVEIRLPLVVTRKIAASLARAESGIAQTPPLRVLIIEDDPDGRQVLRDLLETFGHHVQTAEDGAEGVALAASASVDLLLSDISLPGMNGFEVARKVRDACTPPPYLVALTGYGLPEDRRRSREAGFDEHLVKPIDFRALRRVFEQAAQRHAPAVRPPPTP